MITDAQLTFSDLQAITADAGSTNVVDLDDPRYLQRSGAQGLRFVVRVGSVGFNNLTSLTASVRQSASSNMAAPDTIITGPTVLLAALVPGGLIFDVPWPAIDPLTAKRYLDIFFDVTGAAPTTGNVNAHIVLNSEGGQYALGQTGL